MCQAAQERERGFTLLELLVVVALIGIMISAVVINIGDGGLQERMENEARRLAAIARLTRDEAVLQSQEFSLLIEPERYDVQVLADNRWQPLTDDRILSVHELPEGLALVLEMEDYTFTPKRKSSSEEGEHDREAETEGTRIFFLSSGEVQPFTLYIEVPHEPDRKRFKVVADERGEITWQGPLEPGVI